MKQFAFLIAIVIIIGISCKKKEQEPANPVKEEYTDYDAGLYYWYYHIYDTALIKFYNYINSTNDSLKKAVSYKHIGDILNKVGEYYEAEENLTAGIYALDTSQPEHRKELGYIYNILGNVNYNLKKYDYAIANYRLSLHFLNGDPYSIEPSNGIAVSFQRKGDFSSALKTYDSLLSFSALDKTSIARIIDNRAYTKTLLQENTNVLSEYHQSFKIRRDSADNEGINASYAHLSDYYAKYNRDSAYYYATKMFAIAKENNSPPDEVEALGKLVRFAPSTSEKQLYFEQYLALNDSIMFSRDTTRSRYAPIRYDLQKARADNLELEKNVIKQRVMVIGIIIAGSILLAIILISAGRRRKRIQQEAAEKIKTSQLKTSQKVHDVVANGLYRIMNELEHREQVEKEKLLNKIEVLYEKSRDISYSDLNEIDAPVEQQVNALLNHYPNPNLSVIVIGNQATFWEKISNDKQGELQLILEEIMVNMQKHSNAANVLIKFKTGEKFHSIEYEDDGIGFPPDFQYGNGLSNTVSRTKSLDGTITFGKSPKGGASIVIEFPI